MEIIIAKLINGEFIIGKKTDDVIEKCISLRIIQKSPNQIESHFIPLLHPFSEEFISVDFDKIVYSTKANIDLTDQYNRITSNISIVPNIDLSKLNSSNITPFNPRRK